MSTENACIVTLDVTNALVRMANMKRLYIDLVHEFFKELTTLGAEFDRLLAANDWPAAQRLMHTLKGTAATLGATQLAALAAQLESCCKDPQQQELVRQQVAALNALLQSTHSAFIALLPTLQEAP